MRTTSNNDKGKEEGPEQLGKLKPEKGKGKGKGEG